MPNRSQPLSTGSYTEQTPPQTPDPPWVFGQVFQRPLSLAHLLERAKELNQKSMGTGALTRCVPIAVLAAAVAEPAAAVALARADAALSHPDPTVGNASAAYAATIAQLIIAGDGDRRRALEALQAWILSEAPGARARATSAR